MFSVAEHSLYWHVYNTTKLSSLSVCCCLPSHDTCYTTCCHMTVAISCLTMQGLCCSNTPHP